ncbi:MAG: ATP-binding protein [Candidatus Omnitrophica bacterium]|nr:ATP-binding protein [Candidatus Omnitrophota bacterium]
MKLAHKIFLLISFLLLALCANTWIGLRQLDEVGSQLRDVATRNIRLTEAITTIKHSHLEKSIILERVFRASEELAFEELAESRKQYLLDYLRLAQEGFQKLAQVGAAGVLEGEDIVKKGLEKVRDIKTKQDLEKARDVLVKIEKAHIEYDALVSMILGKIIAGEGYQLSFEDIGQMEQQEQQLRLELKQLLEEIQQLTRESLVVAQQAQDVATTILWWSLTISVLLGTVVVWMIIRRIEQPLKNLVGAAHQVGAGDFHIQLDHSSPDEIGEVGGAFNTMAQKLSDFRQELESKNKMLTENLEVTSQQKKDLEKVNRELDRFVNTVSHDIAAPLTGIKGYGIFLEQNHLNQLDEKGKRCVKGIRKSVDRLGNLIQDLLTLTRISRIKNPYEYIPLRSLVDQVVERLEFSIQEHQVELKISPDLPTIQGDRIKLGEVLFNLMSNAIKFSSKGKQSGPIVEIGYRDGGAEHQIYIKDNGIGIAPEHHEEIFEVFKRLHGSKDYEGTGAGLSIVKDAVEDHGGRVWVESQLGHGSTFYFAIPKDLKQG